MAEMSEKHAGSSKPNALDHTHHLSLLARSRVDSPLKQLYKV